MTAIAVTLIVLRRSWGTTVSLIAPLGGPGMPSAMSFASLPVSRSNCNMGLEGEGQVGSTSYSKIMIRSIPASWPSLQISIETTLIVRLEYVLAAHATR
jgi:hypothetical protein